MHGRNRGDILHGSASMEETEKLHKRTEVVCFPKVALGDRVFNLSTQLAASMSAVDNAEEYGGGTPCESASNKGIQADRMVVADGSEVVMDIQQAKTI